MGQILSSITVSTDMCGMLLDRQEPLAQPVESHKAFQSGMVETHFRWVSRSCIKNKSKGVQGTGGKALKKQKVWNGT